MPILVSGNPGSGKSTLTRELVRRGVRAIDTDLADGLAAWMRPDGTVVGDASLPVTPDLLQHHLWGWSAARVAAIAGELGPRGVLLGIAMNQWDHVHLFETLVLLELDPGTQRERVAERHPLVRQQIDAGLPVLQAQMIERGAVRIDAARPLEQVADDLMEVLDEVS